MRPGHYKMLRLLADGRGYKETASAMGIKPQSVKNYCQTVYRELDVNSLVQAYHKLGWLRVP